MKGGVCMSEAMITAFNTAVTAIQGNVTSMISAALPAGLSIMGIGLAVRVGIGFFRSIAR